MLARKRMSGLKLIILGVASSVGLLALGLSVVYLLSGRMEATAVAVVVAVVAATIVLLAVRRSNLGRSPD